MEIKNKVTRYPERAIYNKDELINLLNRNFICTVSFIDEGIPYAIPMLFSNKDEEIFLHGSKESRIFKILTSGNIITILITEIKEIVLAKNVKNNSINYESAVIFGQGKEVNEIDKKIEAFKILTEKIVPGRWDDSLKPSLDDLKNVFVVSINVKDFSIKKREGPPHDDENDPKNIWSGILPIYKIYGKAENNPPDYIKKLYLSELGTFNKLTLT